MPPRLRRYYGAGYLHFVTSSCYRRHPLLGSARNRNLFLRVLEQVRGAGPTFRMPQTIPQKWLPHPSGFSKGGRQGRLHLLGTRPCLSTTHCVHWSQFWPAASFDDDLCRGVCVATMGPGICTSSPAVATNVGRCWAARKSGPVSARLGRGPAALRLRGGRLCRHARAYPLAAQRTGAWQPIRDHASPQTRFCPASFTRLRQGQAVVKLRFGACLSEGHMLATAFLRFCGVERGTSESRSCATCIAIR